jgi:uncharacterized protein YjbI with pentapeptide repeats
MPAPQYLTDPAYRCLRVCDMEGYHMAIINRSSVDLTGADLRGVDFRNADLGTVILREAYLRDADLRGCDLRHMDLEGVSFHGSKIAGAYFPSNIPAAELQMSVVQGTRVRVSPT